MGLQLQPECEERATGVLDVYFQSLNYALACLFHPGVRGDQRNASSTTANTEQRWLQVNSNKGKSCNLAPFGIFKDLDAFKCGCAPHTDNCVIA